MKNDDIKYFEMNIFDISREFFWEKNCAKRKRKLQLGNLKDNWKMSQSGKSGLNFFGYFL